ncbi:glycosyltransferase [Thermomonas sp.]|uniref:glycosyltransferase n=1 Tax=Thermomonas sp. TaxID=1971895 RepID=UPI002616EAA6|nr:glycosyltransferase [Thermomonas sp.]MCO5054643.1 glycosyltransferase [Thermomonas sp.]
MKPSIAILLPDLRPGGAERLHVTLAREWMARGFGVDFVLRQARGELLEQLPVGARVVDLRAARVRNVLRPLVRYLRQSRPSALLAAMWPLTTVAPVAARVAGYRGRVVVSEHAPLSRGYAHKGRLHRLGLRASTALGYRLADARIGVSAGVADDLARLSGLARERFSVVYNPAASGAVAGAVPALLAGAARPVILTVGTLKPVKRHDLLLDAFAKVAASTSATLCILGDGPQRAALEARVVALGLDGRVLFPGYSPDPAAWYAAADLFVLCSDHEGFGNVIVEAMEQGTPVVCTDCPSGPREILCGGKYGALVPVGDAGALAAAMQTALAAPVDRQALQARARDFSSDKIADQYLDLLLPGWREGLPA